MKRAPFILALGIALILGGCAAPTVHTAPPSAPAWHAIGASREGRPLHARTIGSGACRIYIIGGIHGNETEGQPVAPDLERRLAARPGRATVRLLRDMNPDGTAAGRRGNSAGVDLNRNWPASNFHPAGRAGRAPLSEPETAAAHADMIAFRPHIIIVLHSIRSGPFVNFDGPGAELAARFASAAAELDGRWRVVADMGYATPGSMGSYWGIDREIPILTVELARGEDSVAQVSAAVAGIEAVVASGFRPMLGDASPPARERALQSIARRSDATGLHGRSP